MTSQIFNTGHITSTSVPALNLLTLIATTVLADPRTPRAGSNRFIRETRNLNSLKNLGFQSSETRLLLWYELNKDLILEKMKTSDFKRWFYDVLDSLENLSDKIPILNMMRRISMSGKHPNVNSQALLILAERHWRLA